MKNEHLSESLIQEFILNNGNSRDIKLHLQQCEHCRARTEVYRSMFNGLQKLPLVEFDFDLSELVLNRIERTKFRLSIPVALLFLFATIFLVAISAFIFNQNTISFVVGLQKMALYLLLSTGLVFFVFQAIEIYRGYIKKIKTLNFLN